MDIIIVESLGIAALQRMCRGYYTHIYSLQRENPDEPYNHPVVLDFDVRIKYNV